MEYSPLLSYATAAFEIAAVLFLLMYFGKPSRSDIALASVLFFLAGYQVLEALNCLGPFAGTLTRAAFIDITWLPAAGLSYLALKMENKAITATAGVYIVAAIGFSLWYALFDTSVILSHCDTVIAVYRSPSPQNFIYGFFYQSAMGLMMLLPFAGKRLGLDAETRQDIRDFQIGVASFMIPSAATAFIATALWRALPSVMCHYALLLGILIARIIYRRFRREQGETSNLGVV